MNALKSGHCASNAVLLSTEDPRAYQEHVSNYLRITCPRSRIEHFLTVELASIDWRLRRVLGADTRLLEREIRSVLRRRDFDSTSFAAADVTAEVCDTYLFRPPGAFFANRESQLLRARARTLDYLQKIKKRAAPRENHSEITEAHILTPDKSLKNEPEKPEPPAALSVAGRTVPRPAPKPC